MEIVSNQWKSLTQNHFSTIDDSFISNFRAPGPLNKFAAYDPFEPSSRYLKTLLFTVARKQSEQFFSAYRKIENRDIGSPLTVRWADCTIDADYLSAVEEWEFLNHSGGLNGVKKVVEIGGGFGRTCHTLLTLAPQIEEYVIVDLDPMLKLSEAYLRRVHSTTKVRFISHQDHSSIHALEPDLAINIDSFQEMPPSAIAFYMENIASKAKYFYSKNVLGKYLPSTIGQPNLDPAKLMDVFDLGFCRDVIDIFDGNELDKAREPYLKAYCPPGRKGTSGTDVFHVKATKPMDLFPYFLHALYSTGTQ